MFKFFKRKIKQTTFCYCPKCNNELISSDSFVSDEELVTYKCVKCGKVSKWLFETPAPILIQENVVDNAKEMFGEMRNLTEEEQDALYDALDKISENTGIQLFETV